MNTPPDDLLEEIEKQKQLSDLTGRTVLTALSPVYYPAIAPDKIVYGEIGSYGRGTNTDPIPDIDIMFLDIPADPGRGWVNWTPTDTYSIVANHQGITDIAQLWSPDQHLVKAIGATRHALAEAFDCEGQTKFNWVRSWRDFPGVVFNVSCPVPGFGMLEFDVNLYHDHQYFGIEHTQRFNAYVKRVRHELGNNRAAQLILDIRTLKERVKHGAKIPVTKSLDRSKKVAGIIPEGLFTCLFPPLTFDDLYKHLGKIDTASLPPPDPDCDYTQSAQIVASGMSPLETLHSFRREGVLSDGGWKNLRAALQ